MFSSMRRLRTFSKIYLAFFALTLLAVLVFFLQLYVTNTVNREGVERIATLEKEIEQYSEEIERMDLEIATYSAIKRVESRARELGFEKRENFEYIR